MTKARDIASATTPNANAALLATFPHRNLIINGAMQVAQRGTSFTVNTSNTGPYTLDRMKSFCVGGAEITVTQDPDAPDVFTNSLKVTNSTAQTTDATDYTAIGQYIEGYNMSSTGMGTSAAKDVTLSFWVKSSVTGTYGVTIRAGNAATANYTASYTIDSANTWEQKTITFPATSSGTWYTTNGIGGDVFWDLGVGSDFTQTAGLWNTSSNKFGLTGGTKLTETASATFYITGVQLEVGDTATPFEHRSYGDELARCQRYYYEYSSASSNWLGLGNVYQTDQLICPVYSPTVMRALPTLTKTLDGSSQWLTTYDGYTGTYSNANVSLNSKGTSSIANSYIYITGTGRTGSDGQCHWLTIKADAALHFDAEL